MLSLGITYGTDVMKSVAQYRIKYPARKLTAKTKVLLCYLQLYILVYLILSNFSLHPTQFAEMGSWLVLSCCNVRLSAAAVTVPSITAEVPLSQQLSRSVTAEFPRMKHFFEWRKFRRCSKCAALTAADFPPL